MAGHGEVAFYNAENRRFIRMNDDGYLDDSDMGLIGSSLFSVLCSVILVLSHPMFLQRKPSHHP